MLSGIRLDTAQCSIAPEPRYQRNVKEDMKSAMDLLFQFKEGLEKLHPDCTRMIEKLLHNPNVNNHF